MQRTLEVLDLMDTSEEERPCLQELRIQLGTGEG
jgi:hypothetical protein